MNMDYNDINAHPRDTMLDFDPAEHKYTYGGVELRSVTNLIEDCFEKFDAEYWAERKATPSRPKEAILAEWKAKGQIARDLGTLMHDRIERHYLGELPDKEAKDDPTFRLFLSFAAEHDLHPYRTEWRIFFEEHRIAGTLDFLAFDNGQFKIFDWKRSTKIVDRTGQPVTCNSFGKTALAPLDHLPDTTYWHYALQVSVYRYILEQKYGIRVSEGYLGIFHPDNRRHHVAALPYLRDEVITILARRR